MNISLRKIWAITEVKGKNLFSKNFIIMPLFTVGIILGMRLIFDSMETGNDTAFTVSYLLKFGLIFNISLMGIYVTSAALAEEKEKNTLRTLMTSSVNGLEFFLGSMIPVFLMIMVINIVLIPISGCAFSDIHIGIYLFVTIVSSLTSCIIGMILGIFSKNQVSASTITTPVLMLFTFIPTFSSFVESLKSISQFLFTGVISDMVEAINTHSSFTLTVFQVVILIGEIVISILLFLYIYKKNGFEKD